MSVLITPPPSPQSVAIARAYEGNGLGGSFATVGSFSAGANTLISPASNANGMVLRWWCGANISNAWAAFVASSAPSSVTDGTKRRILDAAWTGNIPFTLANILVPAGLGLYVYANGANGEATFGYDLL